MFKISPLWTCSLSRPSMVRSSHADCAPWAYAIGPASPWQNGFAERLIGSIRRESVNHMIVLGEAHLRRSLKSYAQYDDGVRTHRSLNKDALEHDPEKWVPVFRKRSCSNNKLERYDDSS